MGWSSGSEVCQKILDELLPVLYEANVSQEIMIKLVVKIIDIFEYEDCDTTGELCGDEIINEALETLHPEWYEEEQ